MSADTVSLPEWLRQARHTVADRLAKSDPDGPVTQDAVVALCLDVAKFHEPEAALLLSYMPESYGMRRRVYAAELHRAAGGSW